mmetsp:Transcript_118222/g.314592  ORF Transcript_118222/g.314592 Transcript_118222/m.314592 type:complete len:291 (-) Transcript_118222:68-940(-)
MRLGRDALRVLNAQMHLSVPVAVVHPAALQELCARPLRGGLRRRQVPPVALRVLVALGTVEEDQRELVPPIVVVVPPAADDVDDPAGRRAACRGCRDPHLPRRRSQQLQELHLREHGAALGYPERLSRAVAVALRVQPRSTRLPVLSAPVLVEPTELCEERIEVASAERSAIHAGGEPGAGDRLLLLPTDPHNAHQGLIRQAHIGVELHDCLCEVLQCLRVVNVILAELLRKLGGQDLPLHGDDIVDLVELATEAPQDGIGILGLGGGFQALIVQEDKVRLRLLQRREVL